MSMSSFAAKIGATLIALCFAVGMAGTASAAPVGHSGSGSAPAAAEDCYPGDGHTWH